MTKTKRLGRFLILLLTMVMVLGVFIATRAGARDFSRTKTEFRVTIHVADIKYAGTDSSIYFKVYYVNDKEEKIHLDTKNYNDFERDDCDTYTVTIEHPYWFVKGFGLQNGGGDAMCIDWVSIYVNFYVDFSNATAGQMKRIYRNPGNQWIEKSEYKINIAQSEPSQRSFRQVQPDSGAYKTFTESFEKTVYLGDSGASGSYVEVKWKNGYPVVDDDGVYTEWYNPNKYELPPKLVIEPAYADNKTGKWVDSNNTFNQRFTLVTDKEHSDWGPIGFSYDADSLMKNTPYFAYRVKVTWEFPEKGSSSDHSKSVYYYIYRKQFEMGEPQLVTSPEPYTVMVDGKVSNRYFNSANKTVDFQIPIVAHQNYNRESGPAMSTDLIARKLAQKSGTMVRLYYGEGKGEYLDGSISYNSKKPSYIQVSFPFTREINDSKSLKLVMKGLTVSWDGAPDYSLTWEASYDQKKAREETLGGEKITLGDGAYFKEGGEFSPYKLDNVRPVIALNEKGAQGITAAWRKEVSLLTSPNDVSIYPLTQNAKEGTFTMQLLSGSSPVRFRVYNVDKKNWDSAVDSRLIPTFNNRETRITLPDGVEYKNLTVRLTGRDRAGNEFKLDFPGLNLDTLAPRVTLNTESRPQAIDGSRSTLFRFAITELSGTGRVNYCFVSKGKSLPSETEGKKTSGTINSFVDEWAFISQEDIGGATVVLDMAKGEGFEGDLYYYAVDDAGNRTETVKVPVSINNQAAGCKVEVEPYDHPLPEYQIKFTPDPGCVVYYRYATPTANGEYYRRPYVQYDHNDPKANAGIYVVEQVPGAAPVNAVLDGQQILEYKVVNEKSGNVAYFEGGMGISLTFDNSYPELDIRQTTAGLSQASHSFIVSASDTSGVASASYEIAAADGETVASGDLEIAEGSGSLYAFLGTAELGLGNGSYVLTVTAEDNNGDWTSMNSEPFSIRSAAPEAELTLDGKKPDGMMGVGASAAYELGFTVTEEFAGAAKGHSVFYRVSGDGTVYGEWQKLSDLSAKNGVLSAEAVLNTPLALEEGMNMVFVQLLCAENEKNLSQGVNADSILTLEPLELLLDVNAPSARWVVTCGRNNEALTGTLSVSDDMTANPAVSCSADGASLVISENDANAWLVTYNPGESIPKSFTLTVADEAGNETEVEVTTELLDLDGPTIVIDDPVYTSYGARTDAAVTVTVTEEHPGSVDFQFDETAAKNALVVEDETNPGVYTVYLRGYTGTQPFTVVAADDLGNETTRKSGNVTVKYPGEITAEVISSPAYAQDSAAVVLRFNVPAVAAVTKEAAEALAEEAIRRGTLSLSASCLLELTPEEYEEIKAEGERTMAFTVWVMDEFGHEKSFTIKPDTLFGKEFPVTYELRQNGVAVKDPEKLVIGTHVKDPSDPDDSLRTYSASVYIDCYPINGVIYDYDHYDEYGYFRYENTDHFYRDDYEWYSSPDADAAYNDEDYYYEYLYLIDPEGNRRKANYQADKWAYFIEGTEQEQPHEERIMIFPYTFLTEGDSRIGDAPPEMIDPYEYYLNDELEEPSEDYWDEYYENYDWYGNPKYKNPDLKDYDDKDVLFFLDKTGLVYQQHGEGEDSLVGFSRLAFSILGSDSITENVSSATLNYGFLYYNSGYDIGLQCQSSEPEDLYLYSRTVYSVEGDTVKPYSLEVPILSTDIWMNRTLTIDCPIITVAPAIDYTAIQNTLAPEMLFQATAAGHGAEMAKLKLLYSTDNGSSWNVADAWTEADDGIPALSLIVKLTDSGAYELVKRTVTAAADNADNDVVSDTNLLGDGVTLPADTKFCLYAENIYGLSTLSESFTVTIHDSPLSASDFTVTIAPDGGTAQTAALAENGEYRISETFANSAVARLIPTADGKDRGLTAVNSPSMEVVLTPEQSSYTFQLRDDYGYTFEAAVRFESFDLTPPALNYTLPDVGKTNQPYDVTITASDGESGIDEVKLTLNGSGGGSIELTDNGGGTWTGTIGRSGSYLLTVTDKMGNRSLRSFTVTNIDTVKPKLSQVSRSIPEDVWTQENVVLTLGFDKPNVTIVSAEAGQDDSIFKLDKAARTLTFSGNGTVTVTFRDDYGNVNSDTVEVKNIYDEPPRLAPVVTPANDKMSVQVSFVKARDDNGAIIDIFHDLSELTVMHNGVAYAVQTKLVDETTDEVTLQDAVFLLRENGTYTFTVMDRAGLMQFIKLQLLGIDRAAPVVTAVSWNYTYLDANGNEKNAAYDLTELEGKGYRIAIDKYERTNRDVTVVVTTDKPTAITGSYEDFLALTDEQNRDDAARWGKAQSFDYDQEGKYSFDLSSIVGKPGLEEYWTTEHELIYRANGLYIFNMEKENGLSDHYGVDVEIIDKEAPVLTLTNSAYMMYVEGRDTGSIREALTDYDAWDEYLGDVTNLKASVQVDFGGLDVDVLENNTFDKSLPFTVTYSVKDDAGNETVVKRTVVLVGINDVLVTVNGVLPDSNMMAESRTGTVELKLINFSGAAFATYQAEMQTFGQMKTRGKVIPQDGVTFKVEGLEEGWYTFFVQTETRDYFNIYVYVG